MAERIGVADEVYARVERGRSLPRVGTMVKLCSALGVSADVLLGIKPARLVRNTVRPELIRLHRQLERLNDRTLKLLRMTLQQITKDSAAKLPRRPRR
jgi:transcriptional regulator with XRE-family HTH domain